MQHPARLLFAIAGTTLCSAALAHHPLGGAMPTTPVDGLLSGLAHPVIAIDHLLFVLAAAVLAGLSGASTARLLATLAVFALAGTLGTGFGVSGLTLPLLESLLGASLLVIGLLLWRRRMPAVAPALAFAAFAGFLHGLAYGEEVIGTEVTPVVWYLIGLLLVQCAVLVAVALMVRHRARPDSPRVAAAARGLSGVTTAVGLWIVGVAVLT